MFKICNDKTYYVVQTTSEDVVVEIYTKKDGRGSGRVIGMRKLFWGYECDVVRVGSWIYKV